MNTYFPDNYEETRRDLGIINVLDISAHLPGDPFLVRQSRKFDKILKASPLVLRTGKKAIHTARKAKHALTTKKRAHSNKAAKTQIEYTKGEKLSLPNPTDKPFVSIVIPVYNKVFTTLHCIKSFELLKTKHTFEIVIVDNGSSDQTTTLLPEVTNLQYLRSDENLGFVDGCNYGAKNARGEYIVFLNNDTEITPSWLDTLIEPLLEDKTIGMTGSKLLYPDGSLQEAGGIIFNDASGTNYGKHQGSNDFAFNYRRDVDYCSGASIAIKKSLFDKIGGFDTRYAPAYYEDTDLAFEVRALGLRVVYEPASVAFHIEGQTAGTNVNSGFKKYQVINKEKFYKKWKTTLEKSHVSPAEWYVGRDRSQEKLALVIGDRVLTPDKDSGSQRMIRFIQDLTTLGYKVTFWPMDLKYDEKYTRMMQEMGVEVVYGDISFMDFSIAYGRYYDLVVLSRPYIASSYLEACRAWFYKAKLIYDTVDLHFLRTQRQAELEPKIAEGLNHQAEAYKRLEIGIARRTHHTLVVSDLEKEVLQKIDPTLDISVVSNIHEVKDSAYKIGYDDRKDLLFIGGFDHLPNQDAVTWFVDEIFPAIKKSNPSVSFHVVGASMSSTLKKRLTAVPGVIVHGYVEDVTEIFSHARVFVSPLRYGAGVKGKIGQAIEYGIPVVSTPVGVEGMHLVDGTSAHVATDPKEFAKKVSKVYSDKAVWETTQASAQKVLKKHFSHAASVKGLESALLP